MKAKNEKVFATMTTHFKLGQNDVLVILRQFFNYLTVYYQFFSRRKIDARFFELQVRVQLHLRFRPETASPEVSRR